MEHLPYTGIVKQPRRQIQPWTVRYKGYTIRFCRTMVEADETLLKAINGKHKHNGKNGH